MARKSKAPSPKQAHPAAGLFRMMSKAELEGLAADIKENGLLQPIALTEDGQVLDGRNRLAACEMAGVEPHYITPDSIDPLAYVISMKARCNLTISERAMGAAGAWEMYEVPTGAAAHGKSDDSVRFGRTKEHLTQVFGIGQTAIQQARALLKNDPIAAEAVKNGERPLGEAYEALRQREREAKQAADASARLHAERPDLAELVEAGKLGRDEALLIIDRERREEEEARKRYYDYFSSAMTHLIWPGNDKQGRTQAEAVAERLQGTDLTEQRFREMSRMASEIADAIERRKAK